MTTPRILLAAFPLIGVGCFDASADFELDFDGSRAFAAVTDDGETLLIETCPLAGLFGCEDSTTPMSVVLDGVTVMMPDRVADWDLFANAAYELVVPRPASTTLEVLVHAGYPTRDELDLLAEFAVQVPDEIVRGQRLVVTHEPLMDASATIEVHSICSATEATPPVTVTADDDGETAIELPALAGVCRHEVRVSQEVVRRTASFLGSSRRVVSASLTSAPPRTP